MASNHHDDPAALTSSEIESLTERLSRAREEVVQALNDTSDDALPVDLDLSIGRLSRMDAMQQQQMTLARRQSLDTRQKQIDAALTRVHEGRYGLCLTCDEPIGYRRLMVRPEAWLCTKCQKGGGRDE
jgi:DnaK suppressor protein